MKISERVARSRWHPLSVGSLKRSEKLIGGDALPVFHNAIAAFSPSTQRRVHLHD
jgi:hypothetical protein